MVNMNTLPSYIHLQNVQCLYCRRENYIQTTLYRSSCTGVAQNKNIVKSVYSAITASDHPFVQLDVTRVANPPGMGGRLPEFKSISSPGMLISRNSDVRNAKKCVLF